MLTAKAIRSESSSTHHTSLCFVFAAIRWSQLALANENAESFTLLEVSIQSQMRKND